MQSSSESSDFVVEICLKTPLTKEQLDEGLWRGIASMGDMTYRIRERKFGQKSSQWGRDISERIDVV